MHCTTESADGGEIWSLGGETKTWVMQEVREWCGVCVGLQGGGGRGARKVLEAAVVQLQGVHWALCRQTGARFCP